MATKRHIPGHDIIQTESPQWFNHGKPDLALFVRGTLRHIFRIIFYFLRFPPHAQNPVRKLERNKKKSLTTYIYNSLKTAYTYF
jgi:hypothetical protein